MSLRHPALLASAAFALYAAAGAAAFAQPAPPPASAGGPVASPDGRMMFRHDGGRHNQRFDLRGDRRLDPAAHLRAILQLKPAQEPALTAFLAAMRPAAPQLTPANTAATPRTTPERLALAEKRLADRTAQAHARLDATRRFYDQLDAGQKRAFDELGPMMMDGPGGRMGPPMPVMMHHRLLPPLAPGAPAPPRS